MKQKFPAAVAVIGFCFLLWSFQNEPGTNERPSQKKQLPVFKFSLPQVNETFVKDAGRNIFGITGKTLRLEDKLAVEDNLKLIEIDMKTGAIWASDRGEMWNPESKAQLPDDKKARSIADNLLSQSKLLPQKSKFSSYEFSNTGNSIASTFNTDTKQRSDAKIDVQVNYALKFSPEYNAEVAKIPIIGGATEISVTLGDGGKVIGFSGIHRQIEDVNGLYDMVDQQTADNQFKSMVGYLKELQFSSTLAYYTAPLGTESFIYPVYSYRSTANINGNKVPLRIVNIPATTFNKFIPPVKEMKQRTDKTFPPRRATMKEAIEESGDKLNTKAPLYFKGGNSVSSTPPQSSWKECGTSWIGESGGLAGSKNNAKGFVDKLSAEGWSVNFNWGDANAFESDWRRNDDSWVDAADFVFYTGHANMNGWVLSLPDDDWLDFSEAGASPATPGDMWGQNDLEWVVIAACGPLQDAAIASGGGDVFNRWEGAFDGLHQLLGYGAVTFDNEEEGKKLAQYCRDGNTVIDAWFRAAKEIQPSTNGYGAPDGPDIYVGVVYAYRSGTTSPQNDHIWGRGSVATDPTSPNVFVAIWSRC
jgi:hypothetical protein